jgi:hypothetical protein
MNPEQLAALKEQIKEEVLSELTFPKSRQAWDEIREHIHHRLKPIGIYDRARDGKYVYNAMNAIIKASLGARNVFRIKESDIDRAKKIVDMVVALITTERAKKATT